LASFVKLSVQEIFGNIQSFKTNDGKSCGSYPIGFGTTQKVNSADTSNQSNDIDISSLVDAYMNYYAKSFSKSSSPDESIDAQAKYIVNSLDNDKNGTVSTDELKDFKSSNPNTNLDKQIHNLEDQFKIYDRNQDGVLSLAEIKNALGANRYSIQELGKMTKELSSENQQVSKEINKSSSFDAALKTYKDISENVSYTDYI